MNTTRLICGALVGCAAAMARGGAQTTLLGGSLIITPQVGIYAPSSDAGSMVLSGPNGQVALQLRQQSAPAAGTTLSYWLNDRFALDGGLTYANTNAKLTYAGVIQQTAVSRSTLMHSNVWLANTKLLYQLLPSESAFNMLLGAGPALIVRNGSAYNQGMGLADPGAVFSLCTRLDLSRRTSLRFRGEDYLYRTRLGWATPGDPASGFHFDPRSEQDFVFSLGLQVVLDR